MQEFFCSCKVEIFFFPLDIYFVWPESVGIHFLLIIFWGNFFLAFAPLHPTPNTLLMAHPLAAEEKTSL